MKVKTLDKDLPDIKVPFLIELSDRCYFEVFERISETDYIYHNTLGKEYADVNGNERWIYCHEVFKD